MILIYLCGSMASRLRDVTRCMRSDLAYDRAAFAIHSRSTVVLELATARDSRVLGIAIRRIVLVGDGLPAAPGAQTCTYDRPSHNGLCAQSLDARTKPKGKRDGK